MLKGIGDIITPTARTTVGVMLEDAQVVAVNMNLDKC